MLINLAFLFNSVTQTFGLPAGLLESMCYVESGHNIYAIHRDDGRTDSLGICQVKLATAKWLGFRGNSKELMQPKNNIFYAGKFLAYQYNRYHGDIHKALTAYNRGNANGISISKYSIKVTNNWNQGEIMGFKEIVSLDADTTVTIGGFNKKEKKDNPTSIEGYYLGSRVIPGSKYGDSTLHFLQTPKGNVGVWGKTDLDRKLRSATPGEMIRIVYNGMKESRNGEMHTYKVFNDPENTIEVEIPAAVVATAASDEDDSYSDEDTGDDNDYNVAAEQAARKSKVEALLKGRKN